MSTEYDSYIRHEWQLFINDTERHRDSVDAVSGLGVRCVLDVGSGAGQELLPFATELKAFCIGVDPAPEAGKTANQLFASFAPASQVMFVRANAEDLPFARNTFDVTICRLALPYTDNLRCLSELSRVLRPGGALLLKIHHARYYVRKLRDALRYFQVASALHAARVLVAGFVYLITGKQPRTRFPSRESFQTLKLLRGELARCGLEVSRELSSTNPLTPSFLIFKRGTVEDSG